MNKILKVYIAHQKSMPKVFNKVKEDTIVAVGGYETTTFENGILKLKCDDSYCGLPDKIVNIFKFVSESVELAEYTHIYKLDEDMEFIKEIDFDLTDYMGIIAGKETINRNHHIGRCEDHYWNDKPYEGEISDWCLGGFSYIISRKAAKLIGQVNGKQYPLEDVMVGNTLKNNQIYPKYTNIYQYYKTPHFYEYEHTF
jgi:hypothetical protein